MSSATGPARLRQRSSGARRWRTVDIIVASVLGVVFGVIFWAWDLLYQAVGGAFAAFPPAQALVYGAWMFPAVLVPLIVRRAGAGFYAETLASVVELFLGYPANTLIYGALQGLFGELGFAAGRYHRWGLPTAMLAGGLAGVPAAILDIALYYRGWSPGWMLAYLLCLVISCAVISGGGGWLLTRALARTGVLDAFAAGRAHARV